MNWLDVLVNATLVIMILLLPFAFYRVARKGLKASERLVGVDLLTSLLVGIAVLLALAENNDTTLDIAIAVAALSFAGTVSIARYISEGKVF